MKKIFKFLKALLIIGFLILGLFFMNESFDNPISLFTEEYIDEKYNSEYICLLNRQDKSKVTKKNHKSKAYPASLTKIMTTIVALEHIEDLSAPAPVDVDTYKNMVSHNSSMAGFYGRETTSYRDLLYGTILNSGGEAANSLAINVGGSVNTFVKLMNDKASEIGLKDTHFTNPEGLHDKNQYTTAYDMAKLLDYALDDGNFRAIFTKETFQTSSTLDHPNGIRLKSTVLSRLHNFPQKDFKIIGGKSGTTHEAGQCWATLAIKNDIEYIAIVMGSELQDVSKPDNKHIEDTLKLYQDID